MANVTMIVIFMCVTALCVVICIVATLLCCLDYMKQKRESAAEVEHLRAEVRACRGLLRARAKNEPAHVCSADEP